MLRIQRLVARSARDGHALRGVDLVVGRGERIGLIGASGAGKSTLIRCVNRLVEPDSGAIFLDDLEITALNARALRHARRRIGTVLRGCPVGRLTVMQNVLLGRAGFFGLAIGWLRRFSAADEERAQLVLERLGLTRCADLPVERLSARDRRIVALARALMQEPDILLADDLTEGLHARSAHQIMRLVVDSCTERNLAAIVCILNVRVARTFLPRLVALRDGTIAYDGAARNFTGAMLRSVYGSDYWNGAMTGAIEHVLAARPLMHDLELRAKAR